jgi:hypothetical protein
MKKFKIILLTLFLFVLFSIIMPGKIQAPIIPKEFRTPINLLRVEPPDRVLYYMMEKESVFNPNAYNKREHAAGILQIRPIMVTHINWILQKEGKDISFTLADRFDSTKSVKMYYIYQEHHNPNYDPKLACYLWNGGQPVYKKMSHLYWLEIKRKLDKDSAYLYLINSNIKQNDIYKREL